MSNFCLYLPMQNAEKNIEIPILNLEDESNQELDFVFKTMQEIYDFHIEDTNYPHRHNYYTVIWCREGKGKHSIDFKDYILNNEVVFFVSPEQVHFLETSNRPDGDVFLFSRSFLINYGFSEKLLDSLNLFNNCQESLPIYPNSIESEKLLFARNLIQREYNHNDKFNSFAICSALQLFLIECSRIKLRSGFGGNSSSLEYSQLMQDFRNLLEQHYKVEHQAQFYAQHLNCSNSKLNRIVKDSTGLSAKQYIINRIILEAKRMATHLNLSSKEAAYSLGFDDPAHFSKFFKIQTGKSFQEYKLQINDIYN